MIKLLKCVKTQAIPYFKRMKDIINYIMNEISPNKVIIAEITDKIKKWVSDVEIVKE